MSKYEYEKEQNRLLALWAEVLSDSESFIDSNSEGEEVSPHTDIVTDIRERFDEETSEDDTDDDDQVETSNTRFMLAKDGTKWFREPWKKTIRTRSENIITHLPGVKGEAKHKQNPISCWSLFLTDDLLGDIIFNTNIKINIKGVKYDTNHKYLVKETNVVEIKALLGLLYLAGLYKGNRENIADLWCTDDTGIDVFRKTMSQQRFAILLQCLRFDNIENRAQRRSLDKLAPIRGIFEKLVEHFPMYYTPSEYLTVDEKLEPFRGRVDFLQYIPNKPSKYGLKVHALVDAKTFYCINMEVYVGLQPPGPFRLSNKPHDIVKRLVRPISGSKRNVTFDNWYTSYPLMIDLLHTDKLTSVGTVRKNKTQIPREFLNIKTRVAASSLFAFQGDITAVSYVPRRSKNVILFSTLHNTNNILQESGPKQLPEIIDFYNSTKGGVDQLDQMSANYSVIRNSRRWPLTLFFSFLNTIAINAFVIYKANTKQYNFKRRQFLKDLGLQLITHAKEARLQNKRLPRELRVDLQENVGEPSSKQPKTSKRCSVCPRNKDRKTFHKCMRCHAALSHTF